MPELPTGNIDVTDFIVIQMGDVVAWSNSGLKIVFPYEGSYRFGLALTFRREPFLIQHVLKIGVSADVQLVRSINLLTSFVDKVHQTPMHYRRSDLGFDIVSCARNSGIPKFFRPSLVGAYEFGNGVCVRHFRF